MPEYRVAVRKDYLVFAAGHFITYGGGLCETLHGHNYRVGIELTGGLDRHSLVYDFVTLKKIAKEIVDRLDHRMLLPTGNPALELREGEGEIEVRHDGRRYVFPERDVVLLPIANTTAECLAEWLCRQLARRLEAEGGPSLSRLEVEVEESFGQSAWCALELGAEGRAAGPDSG